MASENITLADVALNATNIWAHVTATKGFVLRDAQLPYEQVS